MLSINDLSEAVQAYLEGSASLDEFADWFHRASRSFFGESKEVQDLCIGIRVAFDALDYDGIDEDAFRDRLGELATASRPLALNTARSILVSAEPMRKSVANEIFYIPDYAPRYTRWGTATRQNTEVDPLKKTDSTTLPCLLSRAEA